MFAGAHARRLAAREDVRIAALCSRNPQNIQKLVDRRLSDYDPAPRRFSSTAEMFAECPLDAVVLVTPHNLHFEQSVEALEAGFHVLVEKPMVIDSTDARSLAEKVAETGKILAVGYNTSYTPACIYTRKAVRERSLGRLEMVSGYLSQDWKRLTEGMWRHDPAQSGGGQAYDSGAHLLNTLCWCVESPVAEVMAYLDSLDDSVDINSVMVVRFESGVIASVAIGGNCPPDGSHTSFLFDDGRIDLDGWKGEWLRVWKGAKEIHDVPKSEGEANPDANFVDAILGKAEPLCTVEHGVIQSELMDAVYESARTGRPVSPRDGGG
jgi:predicted dehydrogenase